MSRHRIIFTCFAEPHRTKTRMIPRLGPEGAARLQGDMTDHALAWARELGIRAIESIVVDGGRRIVVLLRLSPAIPFHLQNYLYGLTPNRFWPYVLTNSPAFERRRTSLFEPPRVELKDRGNRDSEAGDDQRVDFALLDSSRTGSPSDVLTALEMG